MFAVALATHSIDEANLFALVTVLVAISVFNLREAVMREKCSFF